MKRVRVIDNDEINRYASVASIALLFLGDELTSTVNRVALICWCRAYMLFVHIIFIVFPIVVRDNLIANLNGVK